MSGTPNCAIMLPSPYSTIEWTTDWGWMSTSIFEGGRPKSQVASITSSPLFISVAESTVIFVPIRQVGWPSTSETVARRIRRKVWFRNGPPAAGRPPPRAPPPPPPPPQGGVRERPAGGGEEDPEDVFPPVAGGGLEHGRVLAVDGQDFGPTRPGGLDEGPARHHERLLVGQRDPLPESCRRDHGPDRGHPRRGGQHASARGRPA